MHSRVRIAMEERIKAQGRTDATTVSRRHAGKRVTQKRLDKMAGDRDNGSRLSKRRS